MAGFTINHKWDQAPRGVDWTHWWAPSKSMQRWLPWGGDKKSILPQIKSFYLSDSFRQGCADLGITIDETELTASGCISFKAAGKNSKEVIIDSATSLPIEAIYYMLVVQDKDKLERICEYIDGLTLDKNQQQDDILKQDLLNMIMTFHHLLGANPKNISEALIEACIMDSNNYTSEQKHHFMDLLKKKREIILAAINGLLNKMQVIAEQRPVQNEIKKIKILIDARDPQAVRQAEKMRKELVAGDKVAAEIVDLQYLDPKIKTLIKKEADTPEQQNMVQQRFSWLLSAAGVLENLRIKFTQEGVDQIICVTNSETSPFISGLGVSVKTPITLVSSDNTIPPAMQRAFILPRDLQVQCLINNPELAKKYPDVCVLPGQGQIDLQPPTLR